VTTLLGIARFELVQLLRRGSTWVYFGLLLLISVVVALGRAGTWHGFDLGDPLRVANSPLRIASQMLVMPLLSVPIIAAMAGRAVHRDFETGSFPLFFTTPVPRWAYLGGRYLGAVAALAMVFAAVPLGIAGAAASGFGEARRLAPFDPWPYLHAGLLLVLPNLLFIAALFLVLAALTRRMLPNYAGGFVLLVGWGIASILVAAIGEDTLIWMLDPFALIPTYHSVQYWTVVEQNRA
jgi:ABC-2 type transport system permease protein